MLSFISSRYESDLIVEYVTTSILSLSISYFSIFFSTSFAATFQDVIYKTLLILLSSKLSFIYFSVIIDLPVDGGWFIDTLSNFFKSSDKLANVFLL